MLFRDDRVRFAGVLLTLVCFNAFPVDSLAAAFECGTRWLGNQAQYSAQFDWPVPGRTTRKMKLEVGTVQLQRHSDPVTVAKISDGNSCRAICRAKTFEKEGPTSPMALEMSCQASAFDPLMTPATLFWPAALGTRTAVLRFGSWLDGYRNALLKVEFDRYSAQRLAEAR